MKLLRHIIGIVCIVTGFLAIAGEHTEVKGKPTALPPGNAELQLLQGTWEGLMVGDQARQKVSVRIAGDSLRFHRDADFWFDTTITLPPGKQPKQLHAKIKDCPPGQAESIGKVVRAFYKIEKAILTLATMDDDADETVKAFDAAGTRYELRKIQEKTSESVKTK